MFRRENLPTVEIICGKQEDTRRDEKPNLLVTRWRAATSDWNASGFSAASIMALATDAHVRGASTSALEEKVFENLGLNLEWPIR